MGMVLTVALQHDDTIIHRLHGMGLAVITEPTPALAQLSPVTPEGHAVALQQIQIDGDPVHRMRVPVAIQVVRCEGCLLYTSPSPRDVEESRMPSSA